MEYTCQAILDRYTANINDIKTEPKIKAESQDALAKEQTKILLSNDAYALYSILSDIRRELKE